MSSKSPQRQRALTDAHPQLVPHHDAEQALPPHDRERPVRVLARDPLELAERARVTHDDEARGGAHRVRRGLAAVAERARGGREPRVLPERDPGGVDAVQAEGVGDPLGGHDGDHDGEDV